MNWIPGMDHAGIATQALFDKKLAHDGKKRETMDREEYTSLVG